MKKINKLLKKAIVFAMIFTLSVVGLSFSKAYAATDEVSLYDVTENKAIDAGGGIVVKRLVLKIKVKNIDFKKKVIVHWTDDFSSEWKDTEAKYGYSLGNGYEVWTADIVYYGSYVEYALKYDVAGQEYWDNNFGENYRATKYRY